MVFTPHSWYAMNEINVNQHVVQCSHLALWDKNYITPSYKCYFYTKNFFIASINFIKLQVAVPVLLWSLFLYFKTWNFLLAKILNYSYLFWILSYMEHDIQNMLLLSKFSVWVYFDFHEVVHTHSVGIKVHGLIGQLWHDTTRLKSTRLMLYSSLHSTIVRKSNKRRENVEGLSFPCCFTMVTSKKFSKSETYVLHMFVFRLSVGCGCVNFQSGTHFLWMKTHKANGSKKSSNIVIEGEQFSWNFMTRNIMHTAETCLKEEK